MGNGIHPLSILTVPKLDNFQIYKVLIQNKKKLNFDQRGGQNRDMTKTPPPPQILLRGYFTPILLGLKNHIIQSHYFNLQPDYAYYLCIYDAHLTAEVYRYIRYNIIIVYKCIMYIRKTITYLEGKEMLIMILCIRFIQLNTDIEYIYVTVTFMIFSRMLWPTPNYLL